MGSLVYVGALRGASRLPGGVVAVRAETTFIFLILETWSSPLSSRRKVIIVGSLSGVFQGNVGPEKGLEGVT